MDSVDFFIDNDHLFTHFREKFDKLFGTEPIAPDQTAVLPQALDAFQGITEFIKVFRLETDGQRFEILTR